jgi:hypothetical protein
MSPTTTEQAVLNEAVWQAWIEKGKRREQATARKFKLVAGVVLPFVILVVAFYFFSIK